MADRIKKSEIKNFLIEFSRRNQFKPMVVEKGVGRKKERIFEDVYFLGFHCRVEIGSGDKIYLFRATKDYQYIGEIVFEIENPKGILFDKDGEIDSVTITARGSRFIVKVFGRQNEEMRRETIAKVAYFIWQRKGGIGSQELENWAEAERIVQDWERIFTEGFIRV